MTIGEKLKTRCNYHRWKNRIRSESKNNAPKQEKPRAIQTIERYLRDSDTSAFHFVSFSICHMNKFAYMYRQASMLDEGFCFFLNMMTMMMMKRNMSICSSQSPSSSAPARPGPSIACKQKIQPENEYYYYYFKSQPLSWRLVEERKIRAYRYLYQIYTLQILCVSCLGRGLWLDSGAFKSKETKLKLLEWPNLRTREIVQFPKPGDRVIGHLIL